MLLTSDMALVDGVARERFALRIADGVITAAGDRAAIARPDDDVVDLGHRAMLPGTINAHNHSFQSMLRGIADDCNFFTWRDKALYGYTPHMDEPAVYHGARFAFAEMIRNGVTTVCDFFYIHANGNANDRAVIRAAQDLGMRIVLGRTMDDWEGAPKAYQETIPDAVARTRELWAEYRGRDDVHLLPAPHSPHAASPAMIQAGSELAAELGTRFHMHVAEGRYERDQIAAQYGKTPIRWLEEDDIRLMGERDVRLVYNPASNMFLGDGVTRIVDMLAAGVKIGLGSDGGCSNNRVSVFDEMRMCALLQKVTHLSSEVVPAESAFAMGTSGSAETLDIPAGRIAPGHYADFVLLDMDDPSLQPPWSYEKNVVYSMTPHAIREVIVGGTTVFRNGELTRVGWGDVLDGLRSVTSEWPPVAR